MEESLNQLWRAFMWYAGISATITMSLFAWLTNLTNKVSARQNIGEDLDDIIKDLKEIKIALIGDFNKKGLVSKFFDLEKRIDGVEEKIGGDHGS